MEPKTVVIAGFNAVQSLDVTGPAEVFSGAARLVGDAYRVVLAGSAADAFRTSSGLALVPECALADLDEVDTLVVPGGFGVVAALGDPAFLAGVDRLAGRARRVTSVCTGAFVLGQLGWLDGRRATTHWASTAELATRYPAARVEPDRIFTEDGPVWTSAGVTAGIDLALELVARDHGRAVAAEVARWLVMFVQRPGGQTQFSVGLAAVPAETDSLRELQAWMVEHPGEDLSVAALATRCHLSPRTFQRRLRAETGLTPGELVEQIRVEAARRALETTDLPVAAVARHCGFRTVSTLYRAFERRLGVAPAAYRRHFQPTDRSA